MFLRALLEVSRLLTLSVLTALCVLLRLLVLLVVALVGPSTAKSAWQMAKRIVSDSRSALQKAVHLFHGRQ